MEDIEPNSSAGYDMATPMTYEHRPSINTPDDNVSPDRNQRRSTPQASPFLGLHDTSKERMSRNRNSTMNSRMEENNSNESSEERKR